MNVINVIYKCKPNNVFLLHSKQLILFCFREGLSITLTSMNILQSFGWVAKIEEAESAWKITFKRTFSVNALNLCYHAQLLAINVCSYLVTLSDAHCSLIMSCSCHNYYRKSCECIVKTELGHLGGRLKFYPKLWLSEYKLAHLHTCRNFLAHLHTCLNFLAHLHTCRNFRMS